MKRHHAYGFTLVEVIFIIIMMSLIAAVAFSNSFTRNTGSELRTASLQLLANLRYATQGSLTSDDMYMLKFSVGPTTFYELYRKRCTVEEKVDFPAGEHAVFLPAGTIITLNAGGRLDAVYFDRYGRIAEEFPDNTCDPVSEKNIQHPLTNYSIRLQLGGLEQIITIDKSTGHTKLVN